MKLILSQEIYIPNDINLLITIGLSVNLKNLEKIIRL